jgi:hypothetical protein
MAVTGIGLRRRLPPLARAFGRYLRRHPDPYVVSILALRREVQVEIDTIIEELLATIEASLQARVETDELTLAADATTVRFDYDTRLVLPAMLTLGRIHELAGDVPGARLGRQVDTDLLAEGRRATTHVIRALLDGDMRDALNDEEYEDFHTTARPRRQAAAIAQATLQQGVEEWLDRPETPAHVADAYHHAVTLSESHQAVDTEFRTLLTRYEGTAEGSDRETLQAQLEHEYKFAEPGGGSTVFEEEFHQPYFTTQYERVGILYEDMLRMYERTLDVELGDAFLRTIVLMVVAAQIGLDDVDDFPEDRHEQLTPVTAELAMDETGGIDRIRGLVDGYLDAAQADSESHLTGMAIAYVRTSAHDRIHELRRGLGP